MSYAFGIGQHPQTKENVLLVQAMPQPWCSADVLNLLRTIKRGFPGEYERVHFELVLPVNGAGLEIPDEIEK